MKPLVVASHMRSGTHLTIDLLRRNAREVPSHYLNLDRLAPDHREPLSLGRFEQQLSRLGALALLKTHSPAQSAGWFAADEAGARADELLAQARIAYVVRDGRDVMVSLYHYMRDYDARVRAQEFGRFLRDRDDFFQECPGFEGLDRVSAWARHVEGWLERPGAVAVRYEDLLERREPALRELAARLGLELGPRIEGVALPVGLSRRLLRRALRALQPRRASTAIAPRRGRIGDARRVFSASDEVFFRERAGALAVRFAAAEGVA